ncbi:MAG: phage tail protein [Gemmatimonadaceae bacterium]
MAILRANPYLNFNFLVDLGSGDTSTPDAGFEQVQLPEMWLDVIEYRNGNDKENSVRKLTGLDYVGNLILRRGVIGSLTLYQWYNDIRNGNQNGARNVTIQLMSEDHTAVVMTWKLLRARIVRLKWGMLDGKGNDVLIESVELACERLEME